MSGRPAGAGPSRGERAVELAGAALGGLWGWCRRHPRLCLVVGLVASGAVLCARAGGEAGLGAVLTVLGVLAGTWVVLSGDGWAARRGPQETAVCSSVVRAGADAPPLDAGSAPVTVGREVPSGRWVQVDEVLEVRRKT